MAEIRVVMSEELRRRFKAIAAAQGTTMQALLQEFIQSVVWHEKPTK